MTDKHRCYARSNVPWECAECGVSMDTLYLSDTFYLSEMRKRFAALEAERNEAVTKRLEAESREYKAAQPLVDEAFRQRDAMRVDVARLERELADEKRTSTHYADETMGLEREIADAHARINGVWRSKLESCESALVERTRERDEAVACTEKTRVRMVRLEAEVGKLRETIFALLGVMLEAGDSRSPLRSQTPEDQLLIIEETARMAAKVMGITVPDECDRVTLRRAIAIGYARGT